MTKYEEEIQMKGLTTPRGLSKQVDSLITKEEYYIFPGSMITVCCLTLVNGFNVVGESACVSLENFNKELGERIAFDKAKTKIWALEGYLLKQGLYEDGL